MIHRWSSNAEEDADLGYFLALCALFPERRDEMLQLKSLVAPGETISKRMQALFDFRKPEVLVVGVSGNTAILEYGLNTPSNLISKASCACLSPTL